MNTISDRLEAYFTRFAGGQENKLPPRWVTTIINPALPLKRRLRPTDRYGIGLYVRVVLLGLLLPTLFYYCAFGIGVLWLLHRFPQLLHDSGLQSLFIAHVSGRLLEVLCGPLIWIFLSALFELPIMCFWNRRANRLRHESMTSESGILELPQADSTVWPPPPTNRRQQN